MITRRKIKKTWLKRRLRRKHRRNYKKKTNNLFPMILLVLLVFNVGAFIYLINSGNISKDITVMDLLLDTFNIRKISAQTSHQDYPLKSSPEDDDGYRSSEEKIIEDLEEYENLIKVEEGDSNLENIPDPINVEKFSVDRNKEYILAYHTHTTESFLSDDGKNYNPDNGKNVVSVGERITTVLEAQGHMVKHDITVHDLPSFNQSYSRSQNMIIKSQEENTNLKILLDIHRDGRDEDSPDLDEFIKTGRMDIDGVSTARFSLVVGPDAPNYDQILSFAKYIKAVSDVMYPGLCKGIIIKPVGKFNLHFSDYSALLEMGSNWTTLEEANEAGKRVGEILSVALDKLIVE